MELGLERLLELINWVLECRDRSSSKEREMFDDILDLLLDIKNQKEKDDEKAKNQFVISEQMADSYTPSSEVVTVKGFLEQLFTLYAPEKMGSKKEASVIKVLRDQNLVKKNEQTYTVTSRGAELGISLNGDRTVLSLSPEAQSYLIKEAGLYSNEKTVAAGARSMRYWSQEEIDTLHKLYFEENRSIAYIAKALERSEGGIRSRLALLYGDNY